MREVEVAVNIGPGQQGWQRAIGVSSYITNGPATRLRYQIVTERKGLIAKSPFPIDALHAARFSGRFVDAGFNEHLFGDRIQLVD